MQWFNDVKSSDISDKCEDILKLLSNNHGCEVSWSCSIRLSHYTGSLLIYCFSYNLYMVLLQVVEIVIPELEEMRAAHLVSIGSATLSSLTPYCEAGYVFRLFFLSDFSSSKSLWSTKQIITLV